MTPVTPEGFRQIPDEEPEIRPFQVPLITAAAIQRALDLVPTERNSAIVSFTTDGRQVSGALAVRFGEHWSFAGLIAVNPNFRGEKLATAVVRFDWK